MFIGRTDLYSAFDYQGIPTHNNKGECLSKGNIKKLQKQYATQQKIHDKYLEMERFNNEQRDT
jgi:cysteinyl-tRNA synthetase